jgi:Cu-Zn family superoxide dismutase
MRRTFLLAGLLLLFGNFALAGEKGGAASAEAVIKDPSGKTVGTSVLTQTAQGVAMVVEVSQLPPGSHGIHVHAIGKCDPPDFKTAGGHFNPHAKKHGLKSLEGAHAGDLPNLVVGPYGAGKLSATLVGATLERGNPASLLNPNGTSIIIHAKLDDEVTDPTGNSGDRIACGIITGK